MTIKDAAFKVLFDLEPDLETDLSGTYGINWRTDLEVEISGLDPSGVAPRSETQTIAPGASGVFSNITLSAVTAVLYEAPIPGSQIVPVGTVDPTNVSTGDANLINGNFTDLVYNNSSAGATNKELPAIDLGSVQALGICRIYWWSNASYLSSNYSIQISNDGTSFSDAVTGLSSLGFESDFQDIDLTGNSARYVRLFCVTPENATFVVISEQEQYAPSSDTELKQLDSSYSLSTSGTNSVVIVTNNGSYNAPVTVNYLA